MTNQVHWTKDQRQSAKERGQILCAVGVEGNPQTMTQRYEITGPLPEPQARFLFFAASALFDNKSLEHAIALGRKAMKTEKRKKK